MKRISPALQAIFKYKITKYLVEEEVVMNWGILKNVSSCLYLAVVSISAGCFGISLFYSVLNIGNMWI